MAQYTYKAVRSEADRTFIARVREFPSFEARGDSRGSSSWALETIGAVVKDLANSRLFFRMVRASAARFRSRWLKLSGRRAVDGAGVVRKSTAAGRKGSNCREGQKTRSRRLLIYFSSSSF